VFLRTNYRGANYVIIISFFVLTGTLFLAIYDPLHPSKITVFAGVFALAFLTVMFLFAYACGALKIQRPEMARLVIAPWWNIYLCMGAVLIGFVGKI